MVVSSSDVSFVSSFWQLFSWWASLAGSPLLFFPHLFWKRIFGDKCLRFFIGQEALLSSNQQCQSTEGNSKHWRQLLAWLHPFLSTTGILMEGHWSLYAFVSTNWSLFHVAYCWTKSLYWNSVYIRASRFLPRVGALDLQKHSFGKKHSFGNVQDFLGDFFRDHWTNQGKSGKLLNLWVSYGEFEFL